MTAPTEDAVYLDTVTEVTWTQLVTASGLTGSELAELVRYGALVPRDPDAPAWTFEARWLFVARKASRLRHDFELDPHGVSVCCATSSASRPRSGAARAARAARLTRRPPARGAPPDCRSRRAWRRGAGQ